ncbi:hypothetical protein [Caballeronia sp.]|jgi:hypothetical protein|uniref:hypothetical protein n=1 Tax=Caballeronia sp. TaxID=1931223 RepID=UPI003C52B1CB
MSDKINPRRRRFLEMAAVGIGAVELAWNGLARAQSSQDNPSASIATAAMSNASFANIKQIDAGGLNIGYAESGPHNGPVVILLHGTRIGSSRRRGITFRRKRPRPLLTLSSKSPATKRRFQKG